MEMTGRMWRAVIGGALGLAVLVPGGAAVGQSHAPCDPAASGYDGGDHHNGDMHHGYYDREGNWHGGYTDDQGRWHHGYCDHEGNWHGGHYDDRGHWHEQP
jgi:hypothetical protein